MRHISADQASSLKFLYEAETLPVLDAVGIKDAVEVIAFVLDDARMKALRLTIDLPAVRIQSAIADTSIAGNQAAHAGHAQAPLPIRIHFFPGGRDFRVDQDRQRNRRGIGIAGVLVDPEDHDAKRHTDLKRGQTSPSKAFMVRDAAFVISDLTHDNSGAYWEAGYAEGLGKPVIYICEEKNPLKQAPIENGGDKLVHGSGGISQPRAE